MSTAAENRQIAEKWFAAFNEHDLEALLVLYHEDARHYSPKLKLRQPETGGWISGKAALRAWWQDAFERLPELLYIPSSFTADEQVIFMEYLRRVPGEADLQVAEKLEIQSGLISGSRVYHG